ncbi:trans-sulfuration enzyme family protein [Ignicoccus hospitalis]|uniref:Cystathionine gamma-synthase n=1 Tax=Ignicoccus hospitalis (strain KIN4/I / DSM 18386 / JCM 14125) TaxID=453591 RepID=A8ABH7_IGNH4|nr:PLP-dependent aspartate aminotransferase family protein [Ignicoccus hospitalis]ABU82279.1 cystathionine gamma-synthase [Ignicoccus hospitalis KIN4/I]HIH90801.1 PLP-dependent transferase [Desulfurococcaceae archaeon]
MVFVEPPEDWEEETRLVHGGEYRDSETGSIVTPIFVSAIYKYPEGNPYGYKYARNSSPTIEALERKAAAVERAAEAVAFSSGMAAISSAAMALLKPGSKLVTTKDIYGTSYEFFTTFLRSYGIEVDERGVGEGVLERIDKNTDVVFVETISNPLLIVPPVDEIAKACEEVGAKLIVDNTFATPINFLPLKVGAYGVVHSASKYLAGHNDVLGGIFATNDKKFALNLKNVRRMLGGIPDPQQAYFIIRGLKTLHVRVAYQNEAALRIAKFLRDHPKVERVYYPCLEEHPSYPVAKRLLKGCGGVVSFEVRGNGFDAIKVMKKVKVVQRTASLGGVESIITHPATMTHHTVPPEVRKELGIKDNLLRLSVGLENVEDLEADLDQALSSI